MGLVSQVSQFKWNQISISTSSDQIKETFCSKYVSQQLHRIDLYFYMAHISPYYKSVFLFLKFKQLIQTTQHNLHMKMYFEAKFYTFRIVLLFLKIDRKSLILDDLESLDQLIFYQKNSKKLLKMLNLVSKYIFILLLC